MAPESLVSKTQLDNGIRILSESVPYVDSVSVGIWVNCGSRDESATNRGVSHFLEHMLFKGTERRTAQQIADEMDMVGGHLNAFTDKENTCYYARVLSEHLDIGLDVLSDMLLRSQLDPTELEREKNVVLEEIKRYEDTPEDIVHDLFAQTLWRKNALGKPVIGSRSTVSKLSQTALKDYMRANYTPDRIVIAAAGNIEHAKLVDCVAKEFDQLKAAPKRSRRKSNIEPVRETKIKAKKTEQVHFCIGTPGYSLHDDRKYALRVIDTILGGGMSSRLFQEVREKRGLVYAIGSYSASYHEAGLLGIYGGTSPGNFQEVVNLVEKECAYVRDNNVTDEEITRAKNQIRGTLVLSQENMSNRMSRLAKSELNFDKIIPLKEIIDCVMAVTKDDIAEIAQELFSQPEFALAAIGPFNKDGNIKV